MVHVEQRALRAFEEDVLVGLECLVDDRGGVGDHREDPLGVAQVLLGDLLDGVRGEVVDLGEDVVLLVQRGLELLAEDVLVGEVLDAQAHAARLVHIRGADTAAGGADLVVAEASLAGTVEVAVVRHDQVRVGADQEAVRGETVGLELVHLGEEDLWVDDDAVADDRRDMRIHDPGGDEVQLERAATVNDGMARVVAALIANDVIHVVREEVGDLTLAFVAPLSADQHDACHARTRFPKMNVRRTLQYSGAHASLARG